MSHPLDSLRTVADVGRLAAELYGSEPRPAAGVVHVAAGWPSPDGEIRILRITPATPKSRLDSFVLALARARSEAVVTTGKILREEPALQHDLDFTGGAKADGGRALLHEWRASRGLREPPLLAVLSSGRGLDLSHPAFGGWARPLLYTGLDGAEAVRRQAAAVGSRVEVVGVPRPGLRPLIEYLRSERGCGTVSIEAGPSTATALYDSPLAVDELLLSLFRGERPDEGILGGALVSLSRLETLFGLSSEEVVVSERDGPWGFRRYVAGAVL